MALNKTQKAINAVKIERMWPILILLIFQIPRLQGFITEITGVILPRIGYPNDLAHIEVIK